MFLALIIIALFQTLASLLYKAGTECGYVNHKSLLEILGVSERQAYLGSLPKGLFEVTRKVFTTIIPKQDL